MRINEAKQLISSTITKQKEQVSLTFADFLSRFGGTRVYLYGAGAFGRQMFQSLTWQGIIVEGFLDRNAQPEQYLLGIPVYTPDSPDYVLGDKKDITLIISIVMTREERIPLIQNLNNLGFKNIIDGQTIRAYEVPFSKQEYGADWSESALVEKIFSTLELLKDEESINIYTKNLCAHILRDYSDYAESETCRQYFPQTIPFIKGYSRFIDCGAYIGDTLIQLLKSIEHIDTYIGFEPDTNNFMRLANTASMFREKCAQIFLYPNAVGESNQMTAFIGAEGSGSISETGQNQVQVVSIDNVLVGFTPTFIKMDIEGSEIEALNGAQNIICKHRPDLAVCVYHRINDYFEIPLLLHNMNKNYNFYMRAHSSCTMETVLYATEGR